MPRIKDVFHSASYTKALNSEQWRTFAKRVRAQKGNRCQMCRRGDVTLQVHHPFYDPARQLWEYEVHEVIVLCENCHREMHIQLQLFRRVVFTKMSPRVFQIVNGVLAVALAQYNPLVFAHALAEFVSTPSMIQRYAASWDLSDELKSDAGAGFAAPSGSAWRNPETDPPTTTGKILVWIRGNGPAIVNVEERWMSYWDGDDETSPADPDEWEAWADINTPNAEVSHAAGRTAKNSIT